MNIPVPPDLTQEQARLVLWLLEMIIDALIAFDGAMRRTYHIRDTLGFDDEIPF
jgi:hypothetical protein